MQLDVTKKASKRSQIILCRLPMRGVDTIQPERFNIVRHVKNDHPTFRIDKDSTYLYSQGFPTTTSQSLPFWD